MTHSTSSGQADPLTAAWRQHQLLRLHYHLLWELRQEQIPQALLYCLGEQRLLRALQRALEASGYDPHPVLKEP